MEIKLAKTAGFCFGVNRAVDRLYEIVKSGEKVCTLGPIIHNPQVIEDLKSKGVVIADSIDDIPKDTKLLGRRLSVCEENSQDRYGQFGRGHGRPDRRRRKPPGGAGHKKLLQGRGCSIQKS